MGKVRAKFKLTNVEISQTHQRAYDPSTRKYKVTETGAEVYELVEMRSFNFSPVYGNGDPNHENTKFWQASPSGSLKLGTVRQEVWDSFELGAEYYLDFTKAE